jgi:hypothetical protein
MCLRWAQLTLARQDGQEARVGGQHTFADLFKFLVIFHGYYWVAMTLEGVIGRSSAAPKPRRSGCGNVVADQGGRAPDRMVGVVGLESGLRTRGNRRQPGTKQTAPNRRVGWEEIEWKREQEKSSDALRHKNALTVVQS